MTATGTTRTIMMTADDLWKGATVGVLETEPGAAAEAAGGCDSDGRVIGHSSGGIFIPAKMVTSELA